MSGIACIYNVDGGPADRSLLERMIEAAAHRGPDGTDRWISGPVGLGHQLLRATPGSPMAATIGVSQLSCAANWQASQELDTVWPPRPLKSRMPFSKCLSYRCWGARKTRLIRWQPISCFNSARLRRAG